MMKYPFSPERLEALPESIAEIYRNLEMQLLKEICYRLQVAGQLNEVTIQAMRALRAHGITQKEIEQAILKYTGISETALDKLLAEVIERNQEYYSEIVTLSDITVPESEIRPADVDAIMRQTKNTCRNLSASMAFIVDNGRTLLKPAQAYQWALDNAIVQIESGAISYNQAIRYAVKQLADSGLRIAEYESGHKDQIDVAVRRAVMTGVNQLCQRYAEQSMDYLDTNAVEVSAHIGARNVGAGYANHESWQGKRYSWNQGVKRGKYPDFILSTGYGTGAGLGGWNCRHHFYPFVDGVMEPTYSTKDLEEMKGKNRRTFFEGQEYDGYTATQKQREIERTIRKVKRQKAAYKAAGLKEDEQAATIRLRRLNAEYVAFSEAADLPLQKERMKTEY